MYDMISTNAWMEESNRSLRSNSRKIPNVLDILTCQKNVPAANVSSYLRLSPTSSLSSSVGSLNPCDSHDVRVINRNLKLHRAATARPVCCMTGAVKLQSKRMMTSPEMLLSTRRFPKALIVYGESLTKESFPFNEYQKAKMQYYQSAPNESQNKELIDNCSNIAETCTMAASSAQCKTKLQGYSETSMKKQKETCSCPTTRWALKRPPANNTGGGVENGVHHNIPINLMENMNKIYESTDTERLLQVNLSDPTIVRDLTDQLALKQSVEMKHFSTVAPPTSPRGNSPAFSEGSSPGNNREISCAFSQNDNFEVFDSPPPNGSVLNICKKSSQAPSLCSISSSSSSFPLSSPIPIKLKAGTLKENPKSNQFICQISSKGSPNCNGVHQKTEPCVDTRPVQLLCTHTGRLMHTATLIRKNSSNSKSQSEEKSLNANSNTKKKIFLQRTNYNPIQMVYDQDIRNSGVKIPSTVAPHLQGYFTKLYKKQERLHGRKYTQPTNIATYSDVESHNVYKTIKTLEFNMKGPQMIVEKMLIGQSQKKLQRPQTTQNITNTKTFRAMKQRPHSGPSQILFKEKDPKLQYTLPEVQVKEKGKEEFGSGAFHRSNNICGILDSSGHHHTDQSQVSSKLERVLNKSGHQADQSKIWSEREKTLDIDHTDPTKFKLEKEKIQNISDSDIDQFEVRPEIEKTQNINDQFIWRSEKVLNIDDNDTNQSNLRQGVENDLNKTDIHIDPSKLMPEVETLNRNDPDADWTEEEGISKAVCHKGEQSKVELDIKKTLNCGDDQKDLTNFRPETEGTSDSNDNDLTTLKPNIEKVLNHQADKTMVKFKPELEQIHNTDHDKLEVKVVFNGINDNNNNSTIPFDTEDYILGRENIPNNYAHNINPTKPKSETEVTLNDNTSHIDSVKSKPEREEIPISNVHNTVCVSKEEVSSSNHDNNTDPIYSSSEIEVTPNNNDHHIDSATSKLEIKVIPKTKVHNTVHSKLVSKVEVTPDCNTDPTKSRSEIEPTPNSNAHHIDSAKTETETQVTLKAKVHKTVPGRPRSGGEVTNNVYHSDPANLRSELTPKPHQTHKVHFSNLIEEISGEIPQFTEPEIATSGVLDKSFGNLQSEKESSNELKSVDPLRISNNNETKITSKITKKSLQTTSDTSFSVIKQNKNNSQWSEKLSQDILSDDRKSNKQNISKGNYVSSCSKKSDLELITDKLEINKENVNNSNLSFSPRKREKLSTAQDQTRLLNSPSKGFPGISSPTKIPGKFGDYVVESEVTYPKPNDSQGVINQACGDETEVVDCEKDAQRNSSIKRNSISNNFTETSKDVHPEEKDSTSKSEMLLPEDGVSVTQTKNSWKPLPASRPYSYERESISTSLVPPPKLKRSTSSKKSKSGKLSKRKSGMGNKPLLFTSVQQQHLQEPQDDNDHECMKISDDLYNKGVNVSWNTLRRSLHPPTGRPLHYMMEVDTGIPPESDLLNHPKSWLPKEFNALQKVVKKLKQTNQYQKQGRSETKKSKQSGSRQKKTKKKKK